MSGGETVVVGPGAAGSRFWLVQCVRWRYGGETPFAACRDGDADVALLSSVTDLMHFDSGDGAEALRNRLLEHHIGNPSLPSRLPDIVEPGHVDPRYSEMENLEGMTRLEVHQAHGVDSVVLVFHPATSNDRLAVYHQGHRGEVYLGRETIATLLDEGYTVLGLAMPLRGPNPPLIDGEGVARTGHTRLFSLAYERGSAVQLFLEPVRVALNWARAQQQYEATVALGISGGGWTVMTYAAVDPSIDVVAPVASSAPLFARRLANDDWGDGEQNWLPLYTDANYLDLYSMGALGRTSLLVFNLNDSCCFAGRAPEVWGPPLIERVSGLGGSLRILLDDTHAAHAISPFAMSQILEEIELALGN